MGSNWVDGKWTSTIWVGFDGDRTTTGPQPTLQLFQAGTGQIVTTSGGEITSRPAYAWFEWWPNYPVEINNLPVKPGDTVMFQIYTRTAGTPDGAATVYATNVSTNTSRFYEIPRPPNVTSLSASAKWVIEDPSNDLQGLDRTPLSRLR